VQLTSVNLQLTNIYFQLASVNVQLTGVNYEDLYWSKICPFLLLVENMPFLLLVENMSHVLGSLKSVHLKNVRQKCVCGENVAAPVILGSPCFALPSDNIVLKSPSHQ
jgi:hypothetical protein